LRALRHYLMDDDRTQAANRFCHDAAVVRRYTSTLLIVMLAILPWSSN